MEDVKKEEEATAAQETQASPVISTAPIALPEEEPTPPLILEMEIGTVTVEEMSIRGTTQPLHSNTVQFRVKYPKDYKGSKDMPDGSLQLVSKEVAQKFQSLKIGSIVK